MKKGENVKISKKQLIRSAERMLLESLEEVEYSSANKKAQKRFGPSLELLG